MLSPSVYTDMPDFLTANVIFDVYGINKIYGMYDINSIYDIHYYDGISVKSTKLPIKLRLCMGVGPYFFKASICAALP